MRTVSTAGTLPDLRGQGTSLGSSLRAPDEHPRPTPFTRGLALDAAVPISRATSESPGAPEQAGTGLESGGVYCCH